MKSFIRIHRDDNVIIALQNLSQGFKCKLDTTEIILLQDIIKGYTIALRNMKKVVTKSLELINTRGMKEAIKEVIA